MTRPEPPLITRMRLAAERSAAVSTPEDWKRSAVGHYTYAEAEEAMAWIDRGVEGMAEATRQMVLEALIRTRAMLFDIARTKGRAGIEILREDFERCDRAIGALLKTTSTRDAGAYARCSYCGRYSASPMALRGDELAETFAPCDCGGGASGWSGSFERPKPDSQWSIGVYRAEE